MRTYHKIQSVFKRDPDTNYKTLLEGQFSLPEFEYLQNNVWDFTEKVDGTNIRIMFDGDGIRVGGRKDTSQMPATLVNNLNEQFNPQLGKFRELFVDQEDDSPIEVCMYGEGYGPKIQKGGGNYRDTQGFVLFDVNIKGWWLKRADVEDIAKELSTDIVPIIASGSLWEGVIMCREGFNSKWGDFLAEGIVARPRVELLARNSQRIITKIKHKDFS